MKAEGILQDWREVGIQIVSGVGKGGENQHLLVIRIDRVGDLVQHMSLEVLELGVVLGRDLAHRVEQSLDDAQIGFERVLPGRQIHVGQTDLDLAANGFVVAFRERKIVVFGLKVAE